LSLIISFWLLLGTSQLLLVGEALLPVRLLRSTFDASQKLRGDRDVRFGLGLLCCDHLGFNTTGVSRRRGIRGDIVLLLSPLRLPLLQKLLLLPGLRLVLGMLKPPLLLL